MKGQWEVDTTSHNNHIFIRDDRGRLIAECFSDKFTQAIACAPDMIEALIRIYFGMNINACENNMDCASCDFNNCCDSQDVKYIIERVKGKPIEEILKEG